MEFHRSSATDARGPVRTGAYTDLMAGTWKTEAVVLRSIRYGEADRVLHLYTLERGRIGAIAKGARKTKSRFGARLEPFSHVELLLHEGRGELHTVTGADLIRSHDTSRSDAYRMAVGHVGLEAMLRLFIEGDENRRAFHALARFLDLLDDVDATLPARPGHDPLVLSFQLKLLWLAGYLPHLAGCAACGEETGLVGFSAQAGGGVCASCEAGSLPVSSEGFAGMRDLLERPLADATAAGVTDRGRRDALSVIESSYEYHGGFRLKTLAQR
ncbi:MAG: DNA repair protein RecO [Actinobacteria bacterium]|nr:DNA repair protein RecO [Actinomycetota bacterium]